MVYLDQTQAVCVCVAIFNCIHMNYEEIISIENLFQAWNEFRKGKTKRRDVWEFEMNLEDNLFLLHEQLVGKTYIHGDYESFYVQDPKQRHIHKASVRDRIVHHLLYKFLYELFDKSFIYDSYSCRLKKGTHVAVGRLEGFTRIVSKNYTRECWASKCDIKKFFASVDHKILLNLLEEEIENKEIIWLLSEVINSFSSDFGLGKGIPLGNLTSQIFANIYLNELDQFVKCSMKLRFYLRYCDDFVLLSEDRNYLYRCTSTLKQFLGTNLNLELHPKKLILRKLTCGVDFLGYIVLPHYRLPRTKTLRRMFKRLKTNPNEQSLQSYLGYISHANSWSVANQLKNQFWLIKSNEFDFNVRDVLESTS